MAQINALSLAELAIVNVLDVGFDGASDGYLLRSGRVATSLGGVVVRDAAIVFT